MKCAPAGPDDIIQILRCDHAFVVLSSPLTADDVSNIAYSFYGSNDSFVLVKDCNFTDMHGMPVLVLGNFTHELPAGTALKIERIGETAYICAVPFCERQSFG